MALELLPNVLLTEAKVLNGPHVAELVHPEVGVAPAVGHRVDRGGTRGTVDRTLHYVTASLEKERSEVVKGGGWDEGGTNVHVHACS